MTAVNLNRAIRGPVTAVPVVAGKGVRLVADTVNNRFVVELDETVLWEGTRTNAVTLSESAYNFEFLRIEFDENANNAPNPILTIKPSAVMTTGFCFGAGNAWLGILYLTLTGNTGLSIIGAKGLNFGAFTSTTVNLTANVGSDQLVKSIVKVVGVNRIASN